MCRKLAHLVSFVLAFSLFGSICRGLENHNALQEESVIDPNLAYDPQPPDCSIHHNLWVVLSWSPGRYAASHNVYFGDNFDDVNDGTVSAFEGNQLSTFFVIGFPRFAYPRSLIPGTTYYWRIDEVNDLHLDSPWKGDVWSFMIAPKEAYNPNPPDGAEYIDPNVTLSWTTGIAALAHTVYFGDNYDGVNSMIEGPYQINTTYTPGPLEFDKTYYWRVDEYDGFATYKGNIWSFKTKPSDPNLAHSPDLPDGAIHEDLWVSLSWSPGRHAASHNLYFGDNFVDVNNGTGDTFWGNQLSTFFIFGFPIFGVPEGIVPGTTYYWRVDEVNDSHPDSPWKGNVWRFYITPLTACDPYPPDGARLIDPNITLTWTADYRAEFHIVYFGYNFDNVNNATGGLSQQTTTYTPGPLERGKTYYWRVDESNFWTTCKGDVWSFTTGN